MSLFSFIPTTWLWPAVGIAGIAMAGAVGVQTLRLDHVRVALSETKAAWSADRAHAQEVALAKVAEYRSREQAWQAKVTTAEESYAALQTEHAKAIVSQRAALADAGRMRDTIAAYARGSSPAVDTAAAASERAAVLGLLLATALRADGESAIDAESNADAVRAVLAAWPH